MARRWLGRKLTKLATATGSAAAIITPTPATVSAKGVPEQTKATAVPAMVPEQSKTTAVSTSVPEQSKPTTPTRKKFQTSMSSSSEVQIPNEFRALFSGFFVEVKTHLLEVDAIHAEKIAVKVVEMLREWYSKRVGHVSVHQVRDMTWDFIQTMKEVTTTSVFTIGDDDGGLQVRMEANMSYILREASDTMSENPDVDH